MAKRLQQPQFAEIGLYVRRARLAQGLTQRELGRRSGIDQSRISELERGVPKSFASAAKVAAALGYHSLLDLFQTGGEPETALLLRAWRALDSYARRDVLAQVQSIAAAIVGLPVARPGASKAALPRGWPTRSR